jgi:DNA polymerase III epsilon subunit-like protein
VIQPPYEDYVFPQNSVAIHGITTEFARDNGIPIHEILDDLYTLFETYTIDLLVAHNISFDVKALSIQMHRYGRSALSSQLVSLNTYCTMKKNVEVTKLIGNQRKFPNKFKFPKLIELYNHVFPGETFSQHNAKDDMEACARCYFKLVHDIVI